MQTLSRKNIVQIICLAVAFLVCLGIYSGRSQSLPAAASNNSIAHFTDPAMLTDWVPENVFNTTLAYIRYYLAINNIAGADLNITGRPQQDPDGLSFNFTIAGNSTANSVSIQTQYIGGITITNVYVNQQPITINTATQIYGSEFTNFDDLTGAGLTTSQIYEIQQALYTFAPRSNITLNTSSIKQSLTGIQTTITTWTMVINGAGYTAQNTSSGTNDIHLIVDNTSGAQVFDSGVITTDF